VSSKIYRVFFDELAAIQHEILAVRNRLRLGLFCRINVSPHIDDAALEHVNDFCHMGIFQGLLLVGLVYHARGRGANFFFLTTLPAWG
jgi:hypothetical protein